MTNLDSSSMSLPTAINSTVSTMTVAKRGVAKLSFGCWETTANNKAAGETRPYHKKEPQAVLCVLGVPELAST